MTTPAEARATFTAYVRAHRAGQYVDHLREDAADYFAVVLSDGPVPLGEPWLFVSKATGALREVPYIVSFDKVDGMTAVVPD